MFSQNRLSACTSLIIWHGNNPKLLVKAIGEGPTGPIVMEKIKNLDLATPNFVHPADSDRQSTQSGGILTDPKHRMLDIFITVGPMELILYSSIVLMGTSKL